MTPYAPRCHGSLEQAIALPQQGVMFEAGQRHRGIAGLAAALHCDYQAAVKNTHKQQRTMSDAV
jgi:hypothetical protein